MAAAEITDGLTQESQIPGTYTMKSSYTGKMSVTMTPNQGFLPPLKVLEPFSGVVDSREPIKVTWEDMGSAVSGYYVVAEGRNAEGIGVKWESSYEAGSWQRIGLRESLKKGRLHRPDHGSFVIPGGIFEGQVAIAVTGVGPVVAGDGIFTFLGWAQSTGVSVLNGGQ